MVSVRSLSDDSKSRRNPMKESVPMETQNLLMTELRKFQDLLRVLIVNDDVM